LDRRVEGPALFLGHAPEYDATSHTFCTQGVSGRTRAGKGTVHDTCTPTTRVDTPCLARGRRDRRGDTPLLRERRHDPPGGLGDHRSARLAADLPRDRPPHPPLATARCL